MADQYVIVAPDSTGKKIDTAELTVNAQTVERQRMAIGDNTTAANYLAIDATGNAAVVDRDISATGNVTTLNANLATGAPTANSTISVTAAGGEGCASVQVTGTWTGTLQPQGTVDGTNWVNLGPSSLNNITTNALSATIVSAAVGIWQCDIAGFEQFRVTASAAMTGTAVVTVQASSGTSTVALDASLPAGTAVIGALSANQSVNVAQVASGNLSTSATGVQRVGIAGNANAALDAAVGSLPTNNLAAIHVPTTGSGAALSCKTLSAMSTATNVKGSGPGNLYGFALVNGSTSAGFVSFFNTSSTTTSTPVLSYPIGASATVYVPPGALAILNCATGIGIYCSTTVGGTTTITPINGSVFYA
jgi:hypothetical protein